MREREKVRGERASEHARDHGRAPSREPHDRAGGDPPGGGDDPTVLVSCQRALRADPALVGCAIWPGNQQDEARRQILSTEGFDGRISVEVRSGVIFLDGEVPSLGHKRLAGVLARRSHGCRGVVNRLTVGLGEHDSDEERATAVRLAICRDPALDTAEIRVRVRGPLAVLEGTVDSPIKALAAESDAASVLGVERVDNRLVVDPRIRGKA